MNKFVDIVFPGNGSVKDLSRVLSNLRYSLTHILWLTNSDAGEYRLTPVSLTVFDAWAKSHPQYPHSIQFENHTIVVTVMLPPHDGAAGIIAQHIVLNVHIMCQPRDAKIWSRTGRISPTPTPRAQISDYKSHHFQTVSVRMKMLIYILISLAEGLTNPVSSLRLGTQIPDANYGEISDYSSTTANAK
jgi:hypothetical protein